MKCTLLCRLLLEGTVPGKTPGLILPRSAQVCSALLLELFAERNFWAWKCVYKGREKVEINPKAIKLPEENL